MVALKKSLFSKPNIYKSDLNLKRKELNFIKKTLVIL